MISSFKQQHMNKCAKPWKNITIFSKKKTKLDWELFCKEFSDMVDSEKSKQQAKIVLQQIQKHTNESLRSLALRIETLVKPAYTLYTEDYKNSVMSQTLSNA